MRHLLASALLFALPASAEVPLVSTDIAPVHGLVSMVMDGVGTPDLIMQPGASPHNYAMRPSEARALQQADVVVWVGPALTPWLQGPLETLAPDAVHVALSDTPGVFTMAFREGAAFGDHDHDHGHDHGHKEEDHEDEHDHAEPIDPHLWLDPANGKVALSAIAETLAQIDPENAATYRANAEAGQASLSALEAEIRDLLSDAKGQPFIVFHDAYHYFEARFDVEAVAAVSAGDAAKPGAARIAELRDTVASSGARCAFAEPQMSAQLLDPILEGQPTRLAVIDPLGVALEPGAALYPDLLRAMATSLADCLAD